jgi:hypothetical protein
MAPSALGGPSLAAFEHLLGDERGSHRRWPAGVERQMGNDFAQFALFEPVVERTLQVAVSFGNALILVDISWLDHLYPRYTQ